MTLNDNQQAAVEAREPLVICCATPGSGKTRVLVERIKSLITDGVDPDKICALTYTNSAAREIADRLGDVKLGYLGTLHGFCFMLLRNNGEHIGFRPGISLATEEVAEDLFKETIATLGWKGSLKQARESTDRKADLVRRAYADTLKRSNMVDYLTVLEEGLKCIEFLERWSDVLVDEAQDGAVIDWRIYDALNPERLFIVGDGDQSIYGFRGAMPHLFVEWCQRSNAVLIPLEQNYRSDVLICERANRLIKHNKVRLEKWVMPTTDVLGEVTVEGHMDHVYEERSIVGWVRNWHNDHGIPWSEIAVLLRTNALCDQFRAALEASNIPLMRPESIELPADWSRAVDMIALWLNPTSDVLANRLFKNWTTWPKIRVDSLRSGASCAEVAIAHDMLQPRPETKDLPEALARQSISRGTVELIASRVEALPQKNPRLEDLMADVFSLNRIPAKPDRSGVYVGTIHSSKGQEFDAVALPAWEEGVLPSLSKTSSVEEERRLAFVALTRARHHVLITHAAKRDTQYKKGIEAARSRFIDEIELCEGGRK